MGLYTGERLTEIAFPLGGIGTGCVSLSGEGGLIDWEIFNRPNKGSVLPFTFFSVWVKGHGARVVQAPPMPPFSGKGFGVARESGAGLPHLQSCIFEGEFPFAKISFEDESLPVEILLKAFNPFIPLNAFDSGIPVAIFVFTLKNRTKRRVDVSLGGNLFNAVGYPGFGEFYGDFFGGNINRFVKRQGLCGIFMTSERYPKDSPRFGSMALTTPCGSVGYQTCWYRGEWFDSLQCFWDEFSKTGLLKDRVYGPSPEGTSDVGSIVIRRRLKPGQCVYLLFFISWYFPNFEKYWHKGRKKPVWKNFYARWFKNAFNVGLYVARNYQRLYNQTKLFHDTLFDSTLPEYVLDAVSSQLSTLKTPTCLRLEDGTFYGFEGCGEHSGCCEGSCTHVWNYAQALAFLFPDLQRSMREADYRYNQFRNGEMCFRLHLPPGRFKEKNYTAADGQMGGIMKVYRDWKLCGDSGWLKRIWGRVRRALEYAWRKWDKDKDGVMEGVQHNTYDVEFVGPNPMVGGFYLGALRAGEEMARYLGEYRRAREYRRLYEMGRGWMDENLFNGEFYVQGGGIGKMRRYQFGKGCLSDQMIGQWFSHIVGLGYLFDKQRVRRALKSIYRYNWRRDLANHSNCQRVYALGGESGLVLCAWPKGGRPEFPFPYCDEVWTGVEYQVASHLIYEGFVKEGLSIVCGVRQRYDGKRRNPWNEFECGNHYARAMSSYSLLLALSGFSFDMVNGRIGFSPRIRGKDFRCFWCVGSGWGSFRQKARGRRKEAVLEVKYGKIRIKEFFVDGERFEFAGGIVLREGDRLSRIFFPRNRGLRGRSRDGGVRQGSGSCIPGRGH